MRRSIPPGRSARTFPLLLGLVLLALLPACSSGGNDDPVDPGGSSLWDALVWDGDVWE